MLNRQTKVWGDQYENPALFEESLVFYDAVRCGPGEGCADNLHSWGCGRLDNALHGRPRAQQRRPVAGRGETRARPIVEEN